MSYTPLISSQLKFFEGVEVIEKFILVRGYGGPIKYTFLKEMKVLYFLTAFNR
jgi:hypothetical protein